MKRSILISLIPSLLLFHACSSRSLLVVLSEPYWDSLGGGPTLERELSDIAEKNGLRLELRVSRITDPLKAKILTELSRGGVASVVVDPFFSPEAVSIAESNPKVPFILIGNLGVRSGPPNVVRLLFDRRDAFQLMGYAVALSLREDRGASRAARTAILIPRSRMSGDEEISAFLKGLGQVEGEVPPVVKELNEPLDKSAVQAVVKELRTQGVEIFLPRLGEWNSACIDILKAAGGSVVTEDWEGSGAYRQQVFLSVEEDLLGGLEQCLSRSGKGTNVVYGPVDVVCGGARQVPHELEGKIICLP